MPAEFVPEPAFYHHASTRICQCLWEYRSVEICKMKSKKISKGIVWECTPRLMFARRRAVIAGRCGDAYGRRQKFNSNYKLNIIT